MKRRDPVIPNLRYGEWKFHTSKNDDGTPNGSIIAEERKGIAYCIAKQPRCNKDEIWITHAKVLSSSKKAIEVLLDLFYNEKNISEERKQKIKEVLEDAGCYDQDLY